MGLTVQDGKLVVRDGALGTEAACCCDGAGPNGYCCINSMFSTGYTQESCELNGGRWVTLQEYDEFQNACYCYEYTVKDQNGDCPAGFEDLGGPPLIPGMPDEAVCYRVVGAYKDCNNCVSSGEGYYVTSDGIPCDLWETAGPYLDEFP